MRHHLSKRSGVGCPVQHYIINSRRIIITTRIKQTLLVGGAIATVGLAGLGTLGVASAATQSSDPQSSIIDKLATTFKLNKDDVKKVFDEERTAREAEHKAAVAGNLKQLVTDGKLTQEQADKLTAKAQELQTAREADKDSLKDLTHDERKAAMEAKRDELKKWLSDNGIDEKYARFLMPGHHGHGGPGGHHMSDHGNRMEDAFTN